MYGPTPITFYTTASLYNIIIIFDTVVRKTAALVCRRISITKALPLPGQRARWLISTVGNVKIALAE